MSSKLYSRPGVFAWSPQKIEQKGIIIADFAQYFDPTAAKIEQRVDFLSASDIYSKSQLGPTVSVPVSYRFNELCWSNVLSEQHPSGIVAGGTEDGTVVFFDAAKLITESKFDVLSARKDHQGHVLTVSVSEDGKWVASGGGLGQILLWDTTNLTSPFSPGAPNFMDQVKLVRWSGKAETVFASLTSHRVSCWDIRRHGAPILEFGEVGNGCDWAALSWNPSDATSLLIGSQSHQQPVIQKWDLRYATAPLNEFRFHPRGVTSIDWHSRDDRLVLSAGLDELIIWNPENGEIVGGVGTLQGDWIRAARWSRSQPAALAVQYFRHPTQIAAVDSLGVPQPGAEVLAPMLSEKVVPSWLSAPTVGSSLAMGCRHATHWRSFDPSTQRWVFNVEVETIFVDEKMGDEVQSFLRARESGKLESFFEEKGLAATTELEQLMWMFLSVTAKTHSRSALLRLLGFNKEDAAPKVDATMTSTSSGLTTTESNHTNGGVDPTTRSSSPCSSIGDLSESLEKQLRVDWNSIDDDGWNLLDRSISMEHEKFVDLLCERRCYVAACCYAVQHNIANYVFKKYLANEHLDHLSQLAFLLSSFKSRSGVKELPKPLDVTDFPDSQWRRQLGMLIAHETVMTPLVSIMQKLGTTWIAAGEEIRATLPLILAGDVEQLLIANKSLPLADRVFQAVALMVASETEDDQTGPNFDKVILDYASQLANNGLIEDAWKMVVDVCTVDKDLLELRFSLWHAAGGRECTGVPVPRNPYLPQDEATNSDGFPSMAQTSRMTTKAKRESTSSGIPLVHHYPQQMYGNQQQPRKPELAPMPPSSMFYQTPSWDHKPPPPSPKLPPQHNSFSAPPGWNDPPPLVPKKVDYPKPPIMQVPWKSAPVPNNAGPGFAPINPAQQPQWPGQPNQAVQNFAHGNAAWSGQPSTQLPGAGPMTPNLGLSHVAQPIPGMMMPGQPASMSSNFHGATPRPPSSIGSQPSPAAPVRVDLVPEDQAIVDSLYCLVDAILASTRAPVTVNKVTEIRVRLQSELAVRLAEHRLSDVTHQSLRQVADLARRGEFRQAQAIVGQMARNGGDFVEVSSFLPSLKSLFSLANSEFPR